MGSCDGDDCSLKVQTRGLKIFIVAHRDCRSCVLFKIGLHKLDSIGASQELQEYRQMEAATGSQECMKKFFL